MRRACAATEARTCASCGEEYDVLDEHGLCAECAATEARTCKSCGEEYNVLDDRLCGGCEQIEREWI